MLWKSIAFVMLTIACWGIYGPVLHRGQDAMGGGKWRPFLCVGMAYFAIAVVVPIVLMQTGVAAEPKATHGFSFSGIVWSSAGGVAGAVGALGIILAFNSGGKPSWVMPLVFGGAPVVNAFLTIYWTGTWGQVNPMFLAGLILVAMGAVMVMVFKPPGKPPATPVVATAGVDSSISASPPAAETPPDEETSSPADDSTAQAERDTSAAEDADADTSASQDTDASADADAEDKTDPPTTG